MPDNALLDSLYGNLPWGDGEPFACSRTTCQHDSRKCLCIHDCYRCLLRPTIRETLAEIRSDFCLRGWYSFERERALYGSRWQSSHVGLFSYATGVVTMAGTDQFPDPEDAAPRSDAFASVFPHPRRTHDGSSVILRREGGTGHSETTSTTRQQVGSSETLVPSSVVSGSNVSSSR